MRKIGLTTIFACLQLIAINAHGQEADHAFVLEELDSDGMLGFGTIHESYDVATNESSMCNAIDSEGRIVIAGNYASPLKTTGIVVARVLPDGSLDEDFGGGDGIYKVYNTMLNWSIRDVAVDSSDRIIVGGFQHNPSTGSYKMLAARLTTSGNLDTTYGSSGISVVDFLSSDYERGLAIAVDDYDMTLVGGYIAYEDSGQQFALARLDEDGDLDTTFDGDGKVVTNYSSTWGEWITGLAFHSSTDDIIAVGYAGLNFALARYEGDGSLDTTFDGDGKVLTSFSECDGFGVEGYGIALDGNDIVAAGRCDRDELEHDCPNGIAVARYNSNGSLDTGFGGDGRTVTTCEYLNDPELEDCAYPLVEDLWASDVVVDSSHRVTVSGYAFSTDHSPSDSAMLIARYLSNGTLDVDFGQLNYSCHGVVYRFTNYELIEDWLDGRAVDISMNSSGHFFLSGSGRLE